MWAEEQQRVVSELDESVEQPPSETEQMMEEERARQIAENTTTIELNMSPTRITALIETERERQVAENEQSYQINMSADAITEMVERERKARMEQWGNVVEVIALFLLVLHVC